jgi:hypothetical protein
MEKVNIETLINNFILDENVIKNINSWLNKSILNYYSKKNKIDKLSDIIKDIIKNSFSKELDNKELNDYINTLVDDKNEELIASYAFFETDVDEWNIEKDENIAILKKSQFDWYKKLITCVKNEFIKYTN